MRASASVNSMAPSVTGPKDPAVRPPGWVCACRWSMYLRMSCFSDTLSVPSPNTGMFCGPVSMAS